MGFRPNTRRGLIRTTALAGAVALGFAAGSVSAAQPHMQAALAALQNAAGELQQAAANKGGHRERAIALVEQAIEQVRAGIAAAG